MANTRFYYDPCRTKKSLQQSTGPGRYILNVPGNGADPCYIEDPQIIIQKWGANLRTNTINLESDLMGVNRKTSRDCLGKDLYTNYNVPNSAIQYPSCSNLYTEQSRAIMPAWTARDLEQVDWYTLPLNPQENTCLPFQNNLNTRVLEKDYHMPFQLTPLCTDPNSTDNLLPVVRERGGYAGGPNNICSVTNSCGL
jgi:hypothetical protein